MMKHRLSWLRQYWYWGIPVFYLVFLLLPKHYDVWEWGTLLFCILFAFGSGYCFADNEKPGMSECTYGILFGILGSGTMFVTSSLAAYSLTEWPDFIGLKPHWAMLLLPIPLAAGAFYARSRGKSPWGVAGRLLGYWAAAVLVLLGSFGTVFALFTLSPYELWIDSGWRIAALMPIGWAVGLTIILSVQYLTGKETRFPIPARLAVCGTAGIVFWCSVFGREYLRWRQTFRQAEILTAAHIPPPAFESLSDWLRLAEVLKQQYIPAPLPKSGIGCWLIRTGPNEEERRKVAEFLFSADCARLLTEADRLAALPFAVSATAGMTDAKLAEYRKAVEAIKHLSQLSEARALLHHYRQETEQILPEYERAIRLARVADQCILDSFAFSEDLRRIMGLTKTGPVQPQHAEYYRRLFESLQPPVVPDYRLSGAFARECRVLVKQNDRIDRTWHEFHNGGGFLRQTLWRPLTLNAASNILSGGILAVAEYPTLPQCGGWMRYLAETELAHQEKLNQFYRKKQLLLALKIYRCRNGRYPDTLDALVPDILPALPGEATQFEKHSGEHFSLRYAGLPFSDYPDY